MFNSLVTIAREVTNSFVEGVRKSEDTGRPTRVLHFESPEWVRDIIRAGSVAIVGAVTGSDLLAH